MGCCGIDCKRCDCFTATKYNDDNLRVVLAAMWTNKFDFEVSPDMINCHGCESGECVLCKDCEVRICATERNITSCKECADYPCKKVNSQTAHIDESKTCMI